MAIRRDIPQIAELRRRVEARFGKTLAVHADFLALVAVIEMELRQHISESTLERVWGYSTRGYDSVSLRTLDVLTHYAEGCDWLTFCRRLEREVPCESKYFNDQAIVSSSLEVGDRLRFGWMPDRVCVARYLGDGHFVAEVCENSKMQTSDTFFCSQFVLGEPLTMSDLRRGDSEECQAYVVGRINGLTLLQKL